MFRRFWIQPLVDYDPDHGRFSQNCVCFHEADDLSHPTFLTYTIPPSLNECTAIRHMASDKMGVAVTRTHVLIQDSHLPSFNSPFSLRQVWYIAMARSTISIQVIIGLHNYNYKAMLLQHCTSKVCIKHAWLSFIVIAIMYIYSMQSCLLVQSSLPTVDHFWHD